MDSSSSMVVTMIWPYLNFMLFLVLLYKFAKPPLNALALSRKESFIQDSEKASRAFLEAERQAARARERLNSLKEEIARLKEGATKEAAREREKLLKEATELSERYRADATRTVDAELIDKQEKLFQDLSAFVRSRVESKVDADLNESRQTALLKRRINEIGKAS